MGVTRPVLHGRVRLWGWGLADWFRSGSGLQGRDGAKQTVGLFLRTGAEEQGVVVAGHAVAELEGPEAVDLDRVAGRVADSTEVLAGEAVVRVHPTVTEVADEQGAGEVTEPRRRDRHAPRRVELTAGDEPAVQLPVRAEDVDEAVVHAGGVVLVTGNMQCVRD